MECVAGWKTNCVIQNSVVMEKDLVGMYVKTRHR